MNDVPMPLNAIKLSLDLTKDGKEQKMSKVLAHEKSNDARLI